MALACAGFAVALYLWWFRPPVYAGPYDLVIRNGSILDGLGHAPFRADIGIRDGRIVAIGRISRDASYHVIDAEGQIVAPGFIDTHTHIERNLPEGAGPLRAPNFVGQGVTTVITGNCGTSALSLKTIFKRLKKNGSQVNVASFIGHNSVRRKVMGNADREPTADEVDKMRNLVDEGMRQGAIGLSTGLAYVPGSYAKKGELVALSRVVARRGGLYVSHVRDEGVRGVEAIKEACEIGREAGLPVHISHFKVAGRSQWGAIWQRLEVVDQALQGGAQVTLDQYPYTASSTALDAVVPAWALAGEFPEVKRRLHDVHLRARIRSEMVAQLRAKGWDDYSFARIAYCPSDASLNGLNIPQAMALQARVARERLTQRPESGPNPRASSAPKASAPASAQATSGGTLVQVGQATDATYDVGVERQAEFILDLILKGGAQMIYFEMADEDVVTVMKHADTMFGTDSAVRSEDMVAVPHPRGSGTFPRVLSRYVRESGVLSMPEAVRRMTSLPAHIFGLEGRGQITEGYWADLVIFNPDYVADLATYDVPLRAPQGIYYVIVNGVAVFENDHFTGKTPGRPLRHSSAPAKD